MVTTRRMSVGTSTPARAASRSSPSTPSRRRQSTSNATTTPTTARKAPATPKGGRGGGGGGGAGKKAASSATVASGRALRLVIKALGIYACFIYWGIVQERVTTTNYTHAHGGKPGRYTSMVSLNASMGLAAMVVGLVLHLLIGGKTAPFNTFWRAAFSNTIASPIGYLSLRYISFPLMLLVKNCKLVPVMVVGALINGVRYKRYEYVAVALISLGVVLFMIKKGGGHGHGHGGHGGASSSHGPGAGGISGSFEVKTRGASALDAAVEKDNLWAILTAVVGMVAGALPLSELRGLLLAVTNLLIDGFTNAEQDRINQKHGVSPYFMMAMVNIWSLLFASTYLLGDLALRGTGSELATALDFLRNYPGVRLDLVSFAFANALGQVFIYSIIDEFGSLVSVTVTVTRKMITLFLSILIHKHPVEWWQWIGVVSVFGGLILKIFGGGSHGHGDKGKKKK